MSELRDAIRNVPGFPREGIVFRDVTTLLADPRAFKRAVDALVEVTKGERLHKVVSVEARGFVFGAPLALAHGVGLVPARKPGKLPAATVREEYQLEYGTDALEIHRDAVLPGERVLVVDDLLATGGTAAAAIRLVQQLGGKVVRCAFLIELVFLGGRKKLEPIPVTSLIRYDSES